MELPVNFCPYRFKMPASRQDHSTGPSEENQHPGDRGIAGLIPTGDLFRNLSPAFLYEHAIRKGTGRLAHMGALAVETAPFTGRSPGDKFVVRDGTTENAVDWANNAPLSPEHFRVLRDDVLAHLNSQKTLYLREARAGEDSRLGVDLTMASTSPWHDLFAYNMFLSPENGARAHGRRHFTILHAPEMKADPARHGTKTGTFIVLNFSEDSILIGGTLYAGEIKKSIFTVLNFLLPDAGYLPMHCSANVGAGGDTALFFGLSGTGKTTLSTDKDRSLIGDDEHGWGTEGIFNFEGGCYAKAIRLSPDGEPEIYRTTQMFGTILENVVLDPDTREIDFDDASITENTRASFPVEYIPRAVVPARGGHPQQVIFLTCDAFGVLPPISKLSPAQAMYQFLSGYTAKVAGTERGVTEPKAAFSSCFGAPFLPRSPNVYAKMLGEKLERHGSQVWLVNTGWTGGGVGVGSRISLDNTRRIVRAALGGELDSVETVVEPFFGLEVPKSVPGVPEEVLLPQAAWADKEGYEVAARKLAAMFRENFRRYDESDAPVGGIPG
jgi:phosphoenolpyruvate carboxykinase (ATP)